MILTDTGVLIRFLRSKDAKIGHLLRSNPVAICGAIQAEILAGARNDKDRKRLLAFLRPFHYVPFPEASWDSVGNTLSSLYAKGLAVPFPDAVIATVAIENDIEVWAVDPHFAMMQKILPALRLFQEPP